MTTSPSRRLRRSGSWRAALTVPALAATTLLAPAFTPAASAADGDSYQEYEAYCQNGEDLGTVSSTTEPVALNFPVIAGQTQSARANAVAHRAGAYTDLEWNTAPGVSGDYCTTDAAFVQMLTVSAGTSGLPTGAPVTLTATVDMAGELDTSNDPAIPSDALTNFYAEFKVRDLDADCTPGDDGGDDDCSGSDVARVGIAAERESYSMDDTWSDPDGYLYLEQEWSLSRKSNVSPLFEDGDEQWGYPCPSWPCDVVFGDGQSSPMAELVVDPGTQVVQFTTTIGARLQVRGQANAFSAGSNGPATARADLLEGVDGSITAAPGSGVEVLLGTGPFQTVDTTAPTVEITADPAPNADGWNDSDVTVLFSATDEAGGSGVKQIVRGATGANPVPFTTHEGSAIGQVITAEGVTEVRATATDHAGNSGSATKTIRIDKTAPVVTATAPSPNIAGPEGTAVVDYTASATDNLDSAPALSCSAPSGSAFPVGTTAVTCTATDHAGNTASRSFDVVVTAAPGGGGGDGGDGGEVPAQTAAQQVQALSTAIHAMTLKTGVRESLLAHLDQLQRSLTRAPHKSCDSLGKLAKKVEQQAGKGLTPAQLTDLRTRTTQLATTLGC